MCLVSAAKRLRNSRRLASLFVRIAVSQARQRPRADNPSTLQPQTQQVLRLRFSAGGATCLGDCLDRLCDLQNPEAKSGLPQPSTAQNWCSSQEPRRDALFKQSGKLQIRICVTGTKTEC